MPTLHWIGKDKIINHHQEVPFKILEKQYTYCNGKQSKEGNSDSKIIHGDNLEALKSLLPEYEGRVDCIYIDPPYNTGNEGWVYNDNVNHPKLKKWLGEVVGKESEDLTRHDKWLCMMYPRLKLLHKLLSKNGVIFISIGEDEVTNLKSISDEIFGEGNKCGIVSRVMKSGGNKGNYFSPNIDYILAYAKDKKSIDFFKAKMDENLIKKLYNQVEKEGGKKGQKYRAFGLYQSSLDARPNQRYYIECPDGSLVIPPGSTFPDLSKDGEKVLPHKSDGCWRWSAERYIEERKNGNIVFKKSKTKVLVDSNNNPSTWNIYTKIWLSDRQAEGQTPKNIISKYENRHSAEELKQFDIQFNYAKPSKLIKYLIEISTKNKEAIILDSFAGSGSTGQAVLNLNEEDEGNRKFVLIEMEDYAEEITAERIKRVIKGYGKNSKELEGTGGAFNYYTLGKPLFLENNLLNEDIAEIEIKKYVWYTETRAEYFTQSEQYLLGKRENTAYYFFYNKDQLTTLNESFLRSLKTKAEQYIIYADNCLLDKKLMDKYHIVFKKIPRDITRF